MPAISVKAQNPEADVTEYSPEYITAWSDTIAVITDAHSVIITEQGDKATLTVKGSGSDNDYYYRYAVEPRIDTVATPQPKMGIDIPFAGNLQRSSTSMRFLKNIYAGVNMPVGPGKGLKAGWEIGVGEIIGFGYTPNSARTTLSAGFGFAYCSLSAADGLLFAKDGAVLTLAQAPEGSTDPSARMNFWQLQFPLLLTQSVGKHGWGVNFGVILNLNVSAKGSSRWSVGTDGLREKIEIENLHQRFFTPDVFLTIGKRDCVGVYVKFSPMDAMIRYSGPHMSMLSTGLNINF